MGEINFYYLVSFQGICNLGIIVSIYASIAIAAAQAGLRGKFNSNELLSKEHILYYEVFLLCRKEFNFFFLLLGSLGSCLLLSIIFPN